MKRRRRKKKKKYLELHFAVSGLVREQNFAQLSTLFGFSLSQNTAESVAANCFDGRPFFQQTFNICFFQVLNWKQWLVVKNENKGRVFGGFIFLEGGTFCVSNCSSSRCHFGLLVKCFSSFRFFFLTPQTKRLRKTAHKFIMKAIVSGPVLPDATWHDIASPRGKV